MSCRPIGSPSGPTSTSMPAPTLRTQRVELPGAQRCHRSGITGRAEAGARIAWMPAPAGQRPRARAGNVASSPMRSGCRVFRARAGAGRDDPAAARADDPRRVAPGEPDAGVGEAGCCPLCRDRAGGGGRVHRVRAGTAEHLRGAQQVVHVGLQVRDPPCWGRAETFRRRAGRSTSARSLNRAQPGPHEGQAEAAP